MKIDFKSLAFNFNISAGGGTPAWETALGQGAGYKIKDLRTTNELVKGMVYKAVSPKSISFKKGKGGATVTGDSDNASLVIASVFEKVFVNDQEIVGGKFVLLIAKDDTEHHKGRLKLKYGLDNTYKNSDGDTIKNRDFRDLATKQLGLAADACWFVYDISVEQQDTLKLRAIIVNKDGPMTYGNTSALHAAWDPLIEADLPLLSEVVSDSDYDNVLNYNLYGIHIKKDNDALSEDHPHICIGWSKMGDLSAIETREELSELHQTTWPELNAKSKGQNVGQVWRFIKEASIGDYVVFAEDNVCHIGRITSDYYYDSTDYPNQSADYVNVRNVEWLKTNIARNELSQSLHNSLATGMSFWGLNDYKSAVQALLNGTYVKDDVVLEDVDNDTDIFEGFTAWLTSYNNPKYTGTEKYNGYPNALKKLIQFMKEKEYIEDDNLNDINIEKYNTWLDVYYKNADIQNYDKNHNSNMAGIAALKKYVQYIEYLLSPHAEAFDYAITAGNGENRILFGTPGCGKSYHIEHNVLGKSRITKKYEGDYDKGNIIRTTFYQDYSNTDFVGQILPKVVRGNEGEKDTVEYIFNPGPFTLALIQAISNPDKKVALVIEEINRGNAPAIFGDIFQLLDRDENSISEYGIVNVSLMDYLNDYEFIVNGQKKKYHFTEIKIPGNLTIFATMNTSDQNVYTLDTAFVRRWEKEKIKNTFEQCAFASTTVPGMSNYTWKEFVDGINGWIAKHLEDLQVNEDKQIGVFFVKESLLTNGDAEKFAFKVFDYLWSDVAKLDHGIFFNHYDTLEDLIKAYKTIGVGVFKPGIFEAKAITLPQSEANDEQ